MVTFDLFFLMLIYFERMRERESQNACEPPY